MSKMKNRRIWGIELPLISGESSPYINYGEGRYGYVSWENFLKDLSTVKIPKIGPRGGEKWIDIKQAIVYDRQLYNLSTGFVDAEFLKIFFENTFLNINDMVINFKEGSYLLENWKFIKLTNGKMNYNFIRNFKGASIKFNANGVQGFSIWKDNKIIEDRFWSINKAETFINEGGLHV